MEASPYLQPIQQQPSASSMAVAAAAGGGGPSSTLHSRERRRKHSRKRSAGAKLSTDPQSVAARERRHRISDRFKILQSMVPGGTKMDTASMLDEAIHYVKFLKEQLCLHQAVMVSFEDPASPLLSFQSNFFASDDNSIISNSIASLLLPPQQSPPLPPFPTQLGFSFQGEEEMLPHVFSINNYY